MMTFTSRDLVAQGAQLPLQSIEPATKLRWRIQRALNSLRVIPDHWIEFDADRIPKEQLALIVGELVVQGWQAEIRTQRFAPFHSYSGFPKPVFIRVRG